MNDGQNSVRAYIRAHYLTSRARGVSRAEFLATLETDHHDPSRLVDEVILAEFERGFGWIEDQTFDKGTPYTRAFDISRGETITVWNKAFAYDIQITSKRQHGTDPNKDRISKAQFKLLMDELEWIEKTVLILRAQGLTLVQVGVKMNLTREKVRHIERNSSEKLFALALEKHPDKDPDQVEQMLAYHFDESAKDHKRDKIPVHVKEAILDRYPDCETREEKEALARELGFDSLHKLYNLASRLGRGEQRAGFVRTNFSALLGSTVTIGIHDGVVEGKLVGMRLVENPKLP